MKYGIREICDVVFRAKGVQKVGNRIFYKDEPVMYFDTLKTSSLEAASATVYAQGGRGNPRLIAWDGDRTLTFNMEDALISSEGLQILSGAGLTEASSKNPLIIHATSQLAGNDVKVSLADSKHVYSLTKDEKPDSTKTYYTQTIDNGTATFAAVTPTPAAFASDTEYFEKDAGYSEVAIYLPKRPYWPTFKDAADSNKIKYVDEENYIYVMLLDQYGEVYTEPFIPDLAKKLAVPDGEASASAYTGAGIVPSKFNKNTKEWSVATGSDEIDGYKIVLKGTTNTAAGTMTASNYGDDINSTNQKLNGAPVFGDEIVNLFGRDGTNAVLVDYYVSKESGAQQIEITADKFGGSFYIEGDTLFRTQQGLDMPAEFIIPNGKIQSNFTFSMAATGDPSTFTFTVDAMPDYTRFDKTKKVLAAIQIIQDAATSDASRERTYTAAPNVDVTYL